PPPCVSVDDALFTPDGERFVPTGHTSGPWDARSQHGGAPAALLGRAIEALPSGAPMAAVRITVEILHPVPLVPLRVIARIERDGRRGQPASASPYAADEERCRASATRMRVANLARQPSAA